MQIINNETVSNSQFMQKRDTVPNGKTFEEATQICSTAFQASRSYQTCRKYVTDLSNTSLVNCISDVMVCVVVL